MQHLSSNAFWIFALLLVSGGQACNRKDDPCPSNECCFLLFNFGVFSFTFCSPRNVDENQCAQNDYCLRDSDCDGTDTCEGARVFAWGRCTPTGPTTPFPSFSSSSSAFPVETSSISGAPPTNPLPRGSTGSADTTTPGNPCVKKVERDSKLLSNLIPDQDQN